MSADRGVPSRRGRNKSGRANRGEPRAHRSKSVGSTEWLYGIHPVREAMRAGRRRLVRLWIRDGARRPDHDALLALAEEAGVVIEWVDRDRIDACASPEAQTQGVALECGPLPEVGLLELIERAARAATEGVTPRILALDGVEDPQNVGAIARVADSAGAAGLILTERRAPSITPAVARASAGAVEWLPMARVSNLSRALGELSSADTGSWRLQRMAALHYSKSRIEFCPVQPLWSLGPRGRVCDLGSCGNLITGSGSRCRAAYRL